MKFKSLILILGIFIFAGCEAAEPIAQEAKEADTVVQEVVSEKPAIVTPIPTDLDMPETVAKPINVAPVTEKPVVVAPLALDEGAEVILAKCLTASGAKLYTASWCGHCKNQKDAFGDGLEYLNNTECADEDGWAQACTDAGVKAVPTWIFGDGTTKSGNTPLATLAALNGCKY
ncbi:hypothetical protein C0416_01530 [bacterium]|nr:hypothetical protein [bacterium]